MIAAVFAVAAPAAPANAACTTTGATADCIGNVSGGIRYDDTSIATLNINDLTADIAPAGGTQGAWLTSQGDTGHDGQDASTSITNPHDADVGGTGEAGANLTVTYTQPGADASVADSGAIRTTNAEGIFVRSEGGTGGIGGHGASTAVPTYNGKRGGTGGLGGTVIVGVNGAISVSGNEVPAIVAASIGGEGGDGGDAPSGRDPGTGGRGGGAGNVTVDATGTIVSTTGSDSGGINAISRGGSAGDAGGCASTGGCSSASGGDAANGGAVSVTTDATTIITTTGDYANGIYAGSTGGFGGSASSSVGIVAYGSSGGSAGDGGAVSVINASAIGTSGVSAYGIFAQSVGGGGGGGGNAGGLESVGGQGGAGGAGGSVSVTNSGVITVLGDGAIGILAQSVGGAGGDGGNSAGLKSIGGDGGGTSSGGNVAVVNTAAISTRGDNGHGILAQSIGGGGGNGGTSSSSFTSIGGAGGGGGDGGEVTVTNSGSVDTRGHDASGIVAESIGGGGGNGGSSSTINYSSGSAMAVALGGDGGDGGDGKAVQVLRDASDTAYAVTTEGDRSYGILAQSVGGGGGNGGFAIAASGGATSAAIALGGTGGNGGDGGSVLVETAGSITTAGSDASAVLAQSIGGGGGNGGFAVSTSVSLSATLSLGVGGGGGDGGAAGDVTVSNLSNLTTTGDRSNGIFAQSVGGGGGNGGYALSGSVSAGGIAAGLALGGGGGSGNDAGNVDVTSSGTISTAGVQSAGILAQSIGGGGGTGGFAVTASASGGVTANAALGGTGGDGGSGGGVTVVTDSAIVTSGNGASAILAQSIGGGGGNGGFAVAAGASPDLSAALSLGGSGGVGGVAGAVVVDNHGNLATSGTQSFGIQAQSVGGGGGNGGFGVSGSFSGGTSAVLALGGAGGDGQRADAVTVTSGGNITTSGLGSVAIFAQSIGGGGGNGGFSLGAGLSLKGSNGSSVGGTGGDGSDAGAVIVSGLADSGSALISTAGDSAIGILAQSIGGGGGNGGMAALGLISIQNGANDIENAIGGTGSTAGGGGDAGNGAAVTVTVAEGLAVQTGGAAAHGILAQSIGGGGGNGAFSVAGTFDNKGGATANSVGAKGGQGGSADLVTVTNDGTIQVTGQNSNGIVAQSIGGGGGNGGFAVAGGFSNTGDAASNATGGSGANGGAGGTVSVTNGVTGLISTASSSSVGIMAQSIGGGGGNGGFSVAGSFSLGGGAASNSVGGTGGGGGASDQVTVSNLGRISVGGDRSIGILAQSIGGGGGNGGFAVGASATNSDADTTTDVVGGSGAGGGNGGVVDVSTGIGSSIVTTGAMATGIMAQSIGGGGGNGGFAVGGSFTSEGEASSSIGGGAGGGGGTAAAVSVDNAGTISSAGISSIALLAQSIGGGGGNGGFAVSAAFSIDSQASSSAVGGSGGAGGDGGTVDVTNAATGIIVTQAANSVAISAQSIGGGGGNGGFAVSGAFSVGDAAASNAVGGTGGDGGAGGAVTVGNDGQIGASGDRSIGILAQSIGGGGGNGGFAIGGSGTTSDAEGAADIVGGSGGAGGAGGTVTVENRAGALIVTDGLMNYGILAQSIGGGGGNGGFALGGAFSSQGDVSANIGGGAGGGGGDAAQVTVTNAGTILTLQDSSVGIAAQAIGGGGGTGGFAGALGVTLGTGGTTNSVGGQAGAGGGGGNGGMVVVTNESTGSIRGFGANAIGILAQSIGGGGGNGGFSISGSSASGGDGTLNNVGGAGGAGGLGGVVDVTNHGTIVTEGAASTGIMAQSIGGGGGNGGIAVAAGYTNGSSGAISNVGGSGGAGGAGGTVTVNNTGNIVVTGANSTGILAQSIGGGGGNGGMAFAGSFSNGGGSIENNVGGTGGDGGDGGDVTVISTGSITTYGNNSVAVVAQSIGGGGGVGGISISTAVGGTNQDADVTVGQVSIGAGFGTTASSGTDGTVIVDLSGGTLRTSGQLATAALVQLIAGGGGVSGLVVDDPLSIAGSSTIQVGSVNGVAGDVGSAMAPINANDIVTTAAGAMGFVQQSIAGGGGVGAVSGEYDLGAGTTVLTARVGGDGTGGGNANNNTATNTGNITTTGDNSTAILAQSLGGGGVAHFWFSEGTTGTPLGVSLQAGSGQTDRIGNGGQAVLTTSGNTSTAGDLAAGAVAQSIGGGGGFAGFTAAGAIAVGADGLTAGLGTVSGGLGGNAMLAEVDALSGSINTAGAAAPAVVTQSIGGGGGLVGFRNGADVAFNTATLGAAGGTGTAGAAKIDNAATVATTGDVSVGLLAQSIGGGGGALLISGIQTSGNVVLGASAGSGFDGAAVTVANSGSVATRGALAHGIVAQSIGGGGGLVLGVDTSGAQSTFTVAAASSLAGGNGGDVTITGAGAVYAGGAGAHGIVAQSIGGGGGFVGDGYFAGSVGGAGTAGNVTITQAGNVTAAGAGGFAIFAQSVGGSGNGDIAVTIDSGTIFGGSGNGAGVVFRDGATNLLTNRGIIASAGMTGGFAMNATSGNDTVDNDGIMVGSVDLGTGANAFTNRAGAIFASGATVFIGTGNALINAGALSPGDVGRVLTTNVTGNYVQQAGGTYVFDVDFLSKRPDLLAITGTSSLTGTVALNAVNAGNVTPGAHTVTILSAAGGVTDHSGLALDAPSSAVTRYSLIYPNPNDVALAYSIDFQPTGLPPNLVSLGRAINNIQTAGTSPGFAPIAAALFAIPDLAGLTDAYNMLSGEGAVATQGASFEAGRQFGASMQDQSMAWFAGHDGGFTFVDPPANAMQFAAKPKAGTDAFAQIDARNAARPDRWRAWMSFLGSREETDGDAGYGTADLSQSVYGGAFGADRQIDGNHLFGFAVGVTRSSFSVPDRATSGSLDGGHVGVYAMTKRGPWYVAGSLSYTRFSNETTRTIAGVGSTESAQGDFASDQFAGRLEVGRRIDFGRFAATPFSAVEFTRLWQESYSEQSVVPGTGAPGILGLSYESNAVTSLPASLGVRFDTRIPLSGGVWLAPFAQVAWVHEFETDRRATAAFNVAPGFPFAVTGTSAARDLARINTGFNLRFTPEASFFASFNADLASNTETYGASGGFRVDW